MILIKIVTITQIIKIMIFKKVLILANNLEKIYIIIKNLNVLNFSQSFICHSTWNNFVAYTINEFIIFISK